MMEYRCYVSNKDDFNDKQIDKKLMDKNSKCNRR